MIKGEKKAAEGEKDDDDAFQSGDNGKKKNFKNKKNNLKKNSKINKKKQGNSTGNEVADKLYRQFEKHEEVFFTTRLVTQQSAISLPDTADPDPLNGINMMLVDKNQNIPPWRFAMLYTNDVNYSCDDFGLCGTCHESVPHEHSMTQIKPLIGAESDESSGSNRFESIQVPFCMNIRQKLAEQKRSIARNADMMMGRRIDGHQAVRTFSLRTWSSISGFNIRTSAPSDNKPFSGTHMKGGMLGPPLTQVPSISMRPHLRSGQHPQLQRASGMMPPQAATATTWDATNGTRNA